jgi:hypothetical protein
MKRNSAEIPYNKAMSILDWLTLGSYVALNVDIVCQIIRIHRTKSSADLSLFGMTIRYIAIIIILVKFMSLGDMPLTIGQGIVALTFTTYLVLALFYFMHRKKEIG